MIFIRLLFIKIVIQLWDSVENAYVRVFHLSVQLFDGQFFSFLVSLNCVYFFLLVFC